MHENYRKNYAAMYYEKQRAECYMHACDFEIISSAWNRRWYCVRYTRAREICMRSYIYPSLFTSECASCCTERTRIYPRWRALSAINFFFTVTFRFMGRLNVVECEVVMLIARSTVKAINDCSNFSYPWPTKYTQE